MAQKSLVAIIGGSGVEECPQFKKAPWQSIDTGMGIVEYQQNNEIIFIPRHGHSIRYGPSKTQYAANLLTASSLDIRVVVATSAVGSLRPKIHVESLVVPDDYIDETGRDDNLFGEEVVVHANPIPAFSEGLRTILLSCVGGGMFNEVHNKGTYVVISGDRFGTRAEGKRRAEYADIVGMTICPEASMALQLGMHYACAAFPVDTNLDANHVGGTQAVMQRLSHPSKVPLYITKVIDATQAYAKTAGNLPQLNGNVIPGDTKRIKNKILQSAAENLLRHYVQ